MYISKNHVRLVMFSVSAILVVLLVVIGILAFPTSDRVRAGLTAQSVRDADNAANAAEQAAISARKTAESTKQTADAAQNSAKDATKSAKDASLSSDVRGK